MPRICRRLYLRPPSTKAQLPTTLMDRRHSLGPGGEFSRGRLAVFEDSKLDGDLLGIYPQVDLMDALRFRHNAKLG